MPPKIITQLNSKVGFSITHLKKYYPADSFISYIQIPTKSEVINLGFT